MKMSDCTGFARMAAGTGLVMAACDIARGDTKSYVGKLVLPKGTKKEVTWQRGLIGAGLAVTGLAVAWGENPFRR